MGRGARQREASHTSELLCICYLACINCSVEINTMADAENMLASLMDTGHVRNMAVSDANLLNDGLLELSRNVCSVFV